MIALILDVDSFDNFHQDKDRIFRVATSRDSQGEELHWANASIYMGNEMANKIPGVEKIAMLYDGMNADFLSEHGALPIDGFYASQSFFDVFSFNLKQGDPKTALADPKGIVLTETSAIRLFGDNDPLGQIIEVESNREFQQGIVTGVMEDLPTNSHLQFEVLVSMSTLDQRAEGRSRNYKNYPGLFFFGSVYLKLNENVKTEDVESGMQEIIAAYNRETERPLTHHLQAMEDFVTDDKYLNRNGPFFSAKRIRVMIALTVVVLLSACFNYTNLSMARSLRRAKEIGVRKVTGANRTQVFAQFMIESILMSFIAMLVGLGLFYMLKPLFLGLPNPGSRGFDVFQLEITTNHILYCAMFALTTGLMAGVLPSAYLSKLKAKSLVVKSGITKSASGINIRKALIVLQFTLSIGLIMSAVMVHKQYQYALNYDLGYNTDDILNINIKGDYADLLENELTQLPEVIDISRSNWVLGVGSSSAAMIFSEDKSQETRFMPSEVDHNYLTMHGFKFLAGTGFKTPLAKGEQRKSIVVNKGLLSELDLGSPEEAIGKHVLFLGRVKLQIIGVVDNFISTSLNWEVSQGFGFMQFAESESPGVLNLKLKSANLAQTTDAIKQVYEEFDQVHPFEAMPYDDEIAKLYESEKTTYSIISFLAFLAVSISTLGLLGMAVFTTESRMKEIGVRKVLGAGVNGLIFLLSKGFIVMIVLAGVIGIPTTYFIVDKKVLSDFIFRANIGGADLLSGFATVLIIGIITIGLQIRQAAKKNPASILRSD